MTAIMNRNGNFGTLNGAIVSNNEVHKAIIKHLKAGTAKKLVDTDETLMYRLGE